MRGAHFDVGGGTQQRDSRTQTRNLIVGERAAGFDGSEQDLLDPACNGAGPDEAQRGADPAQMVRVPVRLRKVVEIIIFELQNGVFDPLDAGVELLGEMLAHPCQASRGT